jgi:hypothetical protein
MVKVFEVGAADIVGVFAKGFDPVDPPNEDDEGALIDPNMPFPLVVLDCCGALPLMPFYQLLLQFKKEIHFH